MSEVQDASLPTFQNHSSPPTTYTIGKYQTHPLLRAKHLQGHLALLHAFDQIRHEVESRDLSHFPEDVARAMDAEARWAWFVNLAVERFQRWCSSVHDTPTGTIEKTLPPIDVVMVWHTYLLNPVWYAEDTVRISTLSSLPRYTGYLTSHLKSPEILLTNTPNPDRVRFWQEKTMTPYDPFVSAGVLTNVTRCCPRCGSSTKVPILAQEGRGYAQSKFLARCRLCRGRLTKELLCFYKLARDIVKEDHDGLESFLAGTLHSRHRIKDTHRASLIKSRVRSRIKVFPKQSSTSRPPVAASEVMQAFNYSSSDFFRRVQRSLFSGLSGRILRAYSDDRPFSIELVGAILRQGSFIRKMVELGWTQPSFSDQDGKIVLEHCVTRYHAFLNLVASSPESFFVPTLDIDLAWHTHQLMADRYQKDCKALVGRYVDHDDKVGEDHLATAFDTTCRVWVDRYKVPYTSCGCPQPGTTLAQRLRHIFGKKETVNMTLVPPDTAAPSTHASDHNGVFPMHRRRSSMRTREHRRKKSERRRLREARETSEGSSSDVHTQPMRDDDHPDPFLYPVPLNYAPINGCVTGVGGVVNGFTSSPAGAECVIFKGVQGGICSYGAVSCGLYVCSSRAAGGGGGGGGGCGGGGCGGG